MRITNRSVILRALLAALALILALAPISGAAAATMDEELSTADVEATEAPEVTESVATEAPVEAPAEEPAEAPEPAAPEPDVTEPVEEAPAPAEEPAEEVVAPDDAGPAPPVDEAAEPEAPATEEVVAPEDELQAADAPNSTSINPVVTPNADGTVTVTLTGTWDWNRNCGDRIIGWNVDWDDPNATGHPVGSRVVPSIGRIPMVGTPTDNAVHHQLFSNCSPGSTTGTWGPISHTYTGNQVTAQPCVVLYDSKEEKLPNGTGRHGYVAGGPLRNTDNSVEEDMFKLFDCIPVTVNLRSAINIAKTGSTTDAHVGDTVTYTLTVTNGGNQNLSNVRVTDSKCDAAPVRTGGDANNDNILQVTETWTYTCSRVMRANDEPSIVNTATAIGRDPQGSDHSDQDSFTVNVTPGPNAVIRIVKTSPTTIAEVGQTVNYTLTVTNPGNRTLTNIVVTDDKCNAAPVRQSGDANNDNQLQETETWVYTCSRLLLAGDVGNFRNVATATGTHPGGTVTDDDDHAVSVAPAPNPAINIEKTSPTTTANVGDTVQYTMKVTNTGNRTLSNITVTDNRCDQPPVFIGGDSNGDGLLQGGTVDVEEWEYRCSRVLQVGDIGAFENIAVATGTHPNGTVTDNDNHIVNVGAAPNPQIAIDKTSTTTNAVAGQTVNYTLTVTNPGNRTLTNVVVTDDKCNAAPVRQSGDTNNNNQLEHSNAETWVYTCSRVLLAGDVGSFKNTATATGTHPGGTVTDTDDHTVIVTAAPVFSVSISKDPDPQTINLGGTATWTITVRNTSTNNGALTNVVVADPLASNCDRNIGNLAAGETRIYQCTLANVRQSFTNVATVSTSQTANVQDTARVTIRTVTDSDDPSIALVKTAAVDAGPHSPGDLVRYSFTVTNNGDVTLSNVTLNDPRVGGAVALATTTLAPGASTPATATYALTQADIDAGQVPNTATTTGRTSGGQTVTANASALALLEQDPGLDLDKSGPATAALGETITYTFTVTNSGNVTMRNVTITDSMLGLVDLAVSPSTLAPGASGTATATYTVTEADVEAGRIINTALAKGRTPDDTEIDDEDDHRTDIPEIPEAPEPGLELEKSGPAIARVGDTVTYTFTAINTGEVTLTNVTVTDPLLGLDRLTVRPSTLAPGDEGTATATYVITQADADAGSVYNTAVVRGRTPDGTPIRDRDDHTVDVPLVPPAVPPRQLPPPELPATGLGSTGFALTALLSLALGGVLLGIAGSGNLQAAMAGATVNADSPMLAMLRRWNLAPKPGGSQARRRRHR